jgi:ketosteroid isomerase-like protein
MAGERWQDLFAHEAVWTRRELVEAFFKAFRGGGFQALFAVLDSDVVLRPDEEALRMA